MQILMGTEPQGERRRGRIIDHPMQGRHGAAGLEPGEGAGVELGQLAQGCSPGPPAAVPGGAPSALGAPGPGGGSAPRSD
jgi:hypothetical protein